MRVRKLFIYILKLPSQLRLILSTDSQTKAVCHYFKKLRKPVSKSQQVVLVQCVEDLFYFGLFGQIVTSLSEQHPIRVEQFVLRSLNVGEAKSFWIFAKSRLIMNTLFTNKWKNLYQSFCHGVAYSSTSFQPLNDLVDLYRAWSCWNNILNKQMLIDLVINQIHVGDLVNDSFLRFKPAATVDLKNSYLLVLLWQSYRDVRRAQNYFDRVKPKLYLTSYSTYIQHGIAVRTALQYGVKVFSFGNYQEFAKELTLSDWVHTKNPDNYADEFSKLDFKDEKLAEADAALTLRMDGVIDSATSYMKKSAYAKSSHPVPNVHGAVVIFLHDFFDSPHVYRNMVFPDFWEWVCFTIDCLIKNNIPFFVKPHPNQISLSSSVLDELKQKYPKILEIPSSITNKQLVDAGMACAVTVYGTVAHEMAYMGITTIACAHHPHISFDICKTAKNKEEYFELLEAYEEINIDKSMLYHQALAFYYMHNLNLNAEDKSLRDKVWVELSAFCKLDANNYDLVESLKNISQLPAYKVHTTNWINIITGNLKFNVKHNCTDSQEVFLL